MAREKTDERTPSPSEIRVLEHAADGYAYKEIADLTYKSTRTIETHAFRAIKKLGARNITHAIKLAHRRRIINLDA